MSERSTFRFTARSRYESRKVEGLSLLQLVSCFVTLTYPYHIHSFYSFVSTVLVTKFQQHVPSS